MCSACHGARASAGRMCRFSNRSLTSWHLGLAVWCARTYTPFGCGFRGAIEVAGIAGGQNMRIAVLRAAVSSIFLAVLAGAPARAQLNQLEIRQPKVEAGEVEVEYLGDYHFQRPRRRFIEESPGTFVFDDNEFNRQRHSLGIGYGLTSWLGLQVAIEAEQARFEDPESVGRANAFGELKVTEIQLEGTIVLVPAGKHGFAAAALIEHNIALERGEAHQLFLGTALQYARGPWSATANLYLVKNFGGPEERDGAFIRDERWDFQYAAQVKYKVNDSFALALEGYGVIERLGSSGTKSDERVVFGDFDRHLLGPVFYYSWGVDDGAGKRTGKGARVRNADADDKNGDKDGPRYTLGRRRPLRAQRKHLGCRPQVDTRRGILTAAPALRPP